MFLHLVTSATYCGNLVLSGLGPGSALGEKEKKIGVGEKKKKKKNGERSEPRSIPGRGKGGTARATARRYFSYHDPAFWLFPPLQRLVPG